MEPSGSAGSIMAPASAHAAAYVEHTILNPFSASRAERGRSRCHTGRLSQSRRTRSRRIPPTPRETL